MFTYFFRFFEQVVPDQHLYVFGDAALPRCLRTATSNKQETIYCYSETERDAASAKLGGKPEITRFKGLGEISPAEFKQFIGKDMRVRCLHTATRGIRAQGGQRADSLLLHGQEHARAEGLHHGELGRAGGGVRRKTVGRDSVDPSLPTQEARAPRASPHARRMLTPFASLRSKLGSTESHPTGAQSVTTPA